MASANTLCKQLLGVKSAVVTGHDFYQDSDGVNHCIWRNPVAAFAAVSGHGAELVAGFFEL